VLNTLPNTEVKEILTNFYGSLGFNVPYYISSKGTAVSGAKYNPTPQMNSFLSRRKNLLNMIPQIE